MVKQSTHNRLSVGSIPTQPTKYLGRQIGKVVSLKRRNLNVSSNLTRGTRLCECAAEWLGDGLQIRFMQVRVLSLTPVVLLQLIYFTLIQV